MRRLLILGSVLFLLAPVYAVDVWRSSNTATADDAGVLCSGERGFYHGLCINTAASSSVYVFNSSWTTVGISTAIAINANALRCVYLDTVFTQGLTYRKTGTADVSILYECY